MCQPTESVKMQQRQHQQNGTTAAAGEVGNELNNGVTASKTNSSSSSNDSTTTTSMPIPSLLRFWLSVHDTIPCLYIYKTNMDVSITLAWLVVASSIRIVAQHFMTVHYEWNVSPDEHTEWALAAVMAIAHSITLVPTLWSLFANNPTGYNPSGSFDHDEDEDDDDAATTKTKKSTPTTSSSSSSAAAASWWKTVVDTQLQLCTGHMVSDTIWCFGPKIVTGQPLSSSDLMFLGHHFATVAYMTSCRIMGRAHQSAMMCMLLGELTNPFHNMYYFLDSAIQTTSCCHGHTMTETLHAIIKLAFSIQYVLIRVVIGPPICAHMSYNLVTKGRKTIPWVLIAIYNVLIWGVIIGSLPWIIDCWNTVTAAFEQNVGSYFGGNSTGAAEL